MKRKPFNYQRYLDRDGVQDQAVKSDRAGESWRYEAHYVPMEQGTRLDGIREKLFLDRYAMKDEEGNPREMFVEQMWRRVAWAVAQVEKTPDKKVEWEQKFYQAMESFAFLPAGRFLTSAGTGTDTTMINCFVIPSPKDTRSGIIKTLEHVTEISARGGGVGFNLSTLRPRGAYLKSINGTSSGAVSWANLYSVAAHDIIQQGGTRRGALMIMLWDWHPDIEEFITVKKDMQKILGANLSVCVSDAFMEAVKKDAAWELLYPVTDHPAYEQNWDGDIKAWQEKGYPVKKYKTLSARELWDLICTSAWESAEPGVVFLDRYNAMNNTWYFEKNIATNPCGEQGLPAWGVCNLSSVNLAALVTAEGMFDYEALKEVTAVGVRFLDNAVDGEKYLYPEIERQQKSERRTGLGTTGLADALIKMKVRYGSKESLEIVEKIYRLMRDVAYETSSDLAAEKGSFPKFESEMYLESGFMKTLPERIREKIRTKGIRNALLLTQAPTGKISLLAGVSSGIEPVFSFSYTQKDRLGTRTMYHPLYDEWLKSHNLQLKIKHEGTHDTKELPDYFVVADDLTPEEHVRIQALIQKYTDSSISKTVNAPNAHTIDDVKRLYELAYETGCKGVSYMRDGSRQGTLIREVKEEKKDDNSESQNVASLQNSTQIHKPWERPAMIEGRTYKMKTPVGTAWMTLNRDEFGSPIEMFINIGRAGSDVQAMAEALGRLVSKFLKTSGHSTPRERAIQVIDQLRGIGGSRQVGMGPNRVMSLPDAMAKVIAMDMGLIGSQEKSNQQSTFSSQDTEILSTNLGNNGIYMNGNGHAHAAVQLAMVSGVEEKVMDDFRGDLCPECGVASLIHEEGCTKCYGCGYSAC